MHRTPLEIAEDCMGNYEFGMRTLCRLQGLKRYGRRRVTQKRLQRISAEVRKHGPRKVGIALRNLVLSPYHRGDNRTGTVRLSPVHALRQVGTYYNMCPTDDPEAFTEELEHSLVGTRPAE